MKKNGEYAGVDEKFITENEKYVDDDKCRASMLTRHKRETPHITKTYSRTRRGKDQSYL